LKYYLPSIQPSSLATGYGVYFVIIFFFLHLIRLKEANRMSDDWSEKGIHEIIKSKDVLNHPLLLRWGESECKF
jgi:hypothetical protein